MVRQQEKLLISAKEAAQIVGISRSQFYQLHAEGKIPAPVKLGKRVFWREEELREWVDSDCPCRLEWERLRREVPAG